MINMMTYFIYVLLLDDFTRYVGLTTNLPKRIHSHEMNRGSIHTKGREIILLEEYFSFQVDNTWQALLKEHEFAQRKRVEHGRWMVRGGELGAKKVVEYQRKAIVGF